jgi:hypothetical protein
MGSNYPFPCSSNGRQSWQAILDGALREQALETVRTIAASLGSLPLEFASLDIGAAGLAVCLAYCAEGLAEPRYEAAAQGLLDQALTMAEAAPILPWLYHGLAGIGWAASHLSTRLRWPDLEGPLAEIDGCVRDCLDKPVWLEDGHLGGGLAGLGVYALERMRVSRPGSVKGVNGIGVPPSGSSMPQLESGTANLVMECLEGVVDHLVATARRTPEGATWWRDPERMSLSARKKMPDGAYDLGMRHGVAGITAFLARACAAGVAVDRTRPLLHEAVGWLLAQEAPGGPPQGFPYAIRPNRPQRNWTRLSWAYGDPGMAAALLGAARCVGEPAWEGRALAAALRATTRPPERTRIFDACLSVGAAGLGHLFNRLYQATGELRLAEAARFWFERTLAMRRPGHGVAGYAAWVRDDDDVEYWWDTPGVLVGAAGIALALLSAATPLEPCWDRMMLVDIPPARAEKKDAALVTN